MFANDYGFYNQGIWNTPNWGTVYGGQFPTQNWNLPYNVGGIYGNVPFYGFQNQYFGGQYIPQTAQNVNGLGNGFIPTLNTIPFNTIPFNTMPFNNQIIGQGGFYNGTIGQGFTPFMGNLNTPFVGCR